MVASRGCRATFQVDTGSHPIPVLGSQEGTGFVGSGTTDDNTDPLYITGLKENEVYELSFFDNTDKVSGVANNVYIRPGAVTSTVAVSTSSYLHPASKYPTIQVKLGGDQQSIGVLNADSGTAAVAVFVSWRRLT